MYADHHRYLWISGDLYTRPSYSSYVDDMIDNATVRDLYSKPLHQHYLLPSDIYCRSNSYKPIRSYSLSNRYRHSSTFRSYDPRPILPRPISPVEFPRIPLERYQPLAFCPCHRFDFSTLYSYNREPSDFPLAHNYYRLQTDYEKFHIKKPYSLRRTNLKQRWKAYGYILIFYFMLKRNLRIAKSKASYYQNDYHRIRFLELLTAIHRVYLEPHSPVYKSLSLVINNASKMLTQEQLFSATRTILHHITNFLPDHGILGSQSDESVLIYLLHCSLEQYPSSYFWSIERHLMTISFSKMKEHGFTQLDHFTTKFLLISTFLFRGLVKTLLLKPVKYRLTRGQLSRIQWGNTRLLSTLILYIGRHAVIYKEDKARLPMPFPFEMDKYLIDDEKFEKMFPKLEQCVQVIAPKISAWACEYAERLQRHIRTMKTRR